MPALPLLLAAALAAPPLDSVVIVEAGGAFCAGSAVDGGRVLTAYHCIAASGGRAWIRSRDGERYVGKVRGWDVAADLAWLDVAGIDAPTLPIAASSPVPGDAVRAIGHPMGGDLPAGFFEGLLRWSVSEGVISGVGAHALQWDAPVNPGNSGGPVVNADGAVVSVTSRRLNGDGLGFGARTERVTAVLAEDPRRLHPLGGTWALGWRAWSLGTVDGGISVGPSLEIVARDRVVVEGGVALPISPVLGAVRFGASEAVVGDLRLGLRQRFGRGPWAVHVDLLGGIYADQRWTGAVANGRIDVGSTTETAYGGAVAVWARGVGIEVGARADGAILLGATLRWPGTIGVW